MGWECAVNGKRVVFENDLTAVAVRFREPAKHSTRHAEAVRAKVRSFHRRREVPNEKYTVFEVTTRAVHDVLAASSEVDRVAPVFRLGSARAFASDRLLVGLEPKADVRSIADVVHGTIVQRRGHEYIVQLAPSADPLIAAGLLGERNDVRYAEPDFVTMLPGLAREDRGRAPRPRPNEFSARQYALRRTAAIEAWTRVRGRPEIRIAILDDGIEVEHPDLAAAIVGSFDAVDGDTFQEPNPWDDHGTACAGLAAAIHNDIGVRGIAGGCSILAVRTAYSASPGSGWTISSSMICAAIDWARENDAAVLNLSWQCAPSSQVTAAIERARREGRSGKGCVIVVAAGNDASAVGYPANLSNVVCVGATNEIDEPKTRNSSDGEVWWGSCAGPEVTIAAPGVRNFTTARSAGYRRDFYGTSSSAAIVAGAAALVLSAKPSLSEADVRRILVETADKVGGVPYDASGHHPLMGYGRVNVAAAVARALAG